ncbi:MAG: alginate export family protein [Methylococcales bacterium]|nr:alginate export family protein [Methylococcales bacterium]
MKPRKELTGTAISYAMNLIISGGLCIGAIDEIQAAEKKKYVRVPFTSYSSQMQDALLGSDKYAKPVWNLHDALKAPDWLDIGVDQRTRYETMSNSIKAGSKGGDQQIALQSTLWLQAHMGAYRVGTEFMDARALNSDKATDVNNTMVDTWDFLQAYAAWADQNVLYSGIGAEVIAGRQTLNFGSRRLVARHIFRNTVNSFTGVRLRLTNYEKWQFNGFVSTPVDRLPASSAATLNNQQVFDREDTHTWFSGGILELSDLGFGINNEIYLYHLDEGSSTSAPTRHRRYFTPGMRFFIKPAKAEIDFQLETTGQFGWVRETTNPNSKKLDHTAWFQHADIGYTIDMPWSPRLGLEYDYASGDKNPYDNKDERFDTLYSVRRDDFGPTGIFGAFSRSNINSPGLRINLAPRSDVQFILSHRLYWLASATDCWGNATCSGSSFVLQDKTGRSGNNLGQELNLMTRWDFNSSLNFETGWSHLFKGPFAKNAPNAPAPVDVDYFYVQSMLRF